MADSSVINLQRGVGSIRAIDEKLSVNPSSGRGAFSIPFTVPVEKKLPCQNLNDIRILIFDQNEEVRNSLSSLLIKTEGFFCSGNFKDGSYLIQRIKAVQPQILVLDVKLAGLCSVTVVKLIRAHFPNIQILMLAVSADDDIVFNAICAGALGYILKSQPFENTLEAIRGLRQGYRPISPSVLQRLIERLHCLNAPMAINPFGLTAREMEVMNQLIEGASYKIAGHRIGICYNTVHNHIKNIYGKLKVNSMSEAV